MKYMLLIHQGTTPTPRDPRRGRPLRGRAEGGLRRLRGDQPDAGRHPRRAACSRPRRRRPCACRTARRSRPTARSPSSRRPSAATCFFEADDLDAAIELAAKIPAARLGGAIEVRPIVEWLAILEQASATSGAASSPRLIGFLGDFDLAEEAAQEAFAIAAERWPRDGVPANPGAWLVTTARNRAIDRIRRDRTLAEKTPAARGARGGGGRRGRDDLSRTSGSSSSSPAAIRRSRPTRRSRSPCARSAA